MSAKKHICVVCGTDISHKNSHAIYCSSYCSNVNQGKYKYQFVKRRCLKCKKDISKTHGKTRICQECKNKISQTELSQLSIANSMNKGGFIEQLQAKIRNLEQKIELQKRDIFILTRESHTDKEGITIKWNETFKREKGK